MSSKAVGQVHPGLVMLLAAGLAACAREAAPTHPAVSVPVASASASASVSASPLLATPAALKTWLDAPDNDPKVMEMGRAALTCPWLTYGFSQDCAPMKAWEAAEEPFKDGKADPTLVNMLEDADKSARLIAVRKLDTWGRVFRADRALAARVVAAAERERFAESDLAARLGSVVARIDVEGTGLLARVVAMAQVHPLRLVRSYLVKSLPQYNPTSAEVRRVVEGAINDSSWEVRLSSAEAYQFVEAGAAESCGFWYANLTHKDAQVVGQCAYGLSEDRCAPLHDRLLSTLERSSALTAPFSSMAPALENLCKGKAATRASRGRAAALARRIAEKGASVAGCIPDNIRQEALSAVVACDPKGAKAYVSGFLKDPSEEMRKHAEALIKGI